MDGAGSSSGEVSSTSATGQRPRADPELRQPTDDVYLIAFMRNLALMAPSRVRVQSRRNDTEATAIFVDFRDAGATDDDAHGVFGFGLGAVPVPASGVAVACLPETTVGEGDGEARGRGECAVCLEEYVAGDVLRTMPCEHGFHERCIFGWLRVSRLCPLCRFALPPEEGTAADVEEDVR